MDTIMYYISLPLGYLMKLCHMIVSNYGLAIILFTLATKFILLPISIWIQKNSILMVKIQPEINFLKARLYGNMDAIADEQSKLFKREKYHPMLSLIPLILQIFLLLAVVSIIYHPMDYLFGFSDSSIKALAEFLKLDMAESSFQLEIIEAIKEGTIKVEQFAEIGIAETELKNICTKLIGFDSTFLGMNLSSVPKVVGGWYFLMPIVAGLSSWVLCFTQNMSNVIQHEQSKWNQYGIMALSVALSLYLGLFVPSGIALYWVASNLMSVAQMYLLNIAINPKKYVDYELLEESRQELAKAKEFMASDKNDSSKKENKKREKQDYKKFMKVVNKHIVFYSEKSGFYKYYEGIINELLKRSNLTIHYITNDPNDIIFKIAENQPKIQPYYISLKKTSLLMMLVSVDIFVMSTPDLDKYYLKRSFIKKDIEYIYVPHDMMSIHMSFKEGAFNAFDTIFCTGQHVVNEMRETEKVYKLKEKNLVEFGYPLADLLKVKGEEANKEPRNSSVKEILIAPSWQEDNLLDSCIDTLIEKLYSDEYHLIVRPHPEYVKRYGIQMNKLVEKYKDYDDKKLSFELDFSSNKSIYSADLIITDWSGIAPEFSFATNRPALFVNTQVKCLNPNWEKINLTPVEVSLRNELGVAIDKEDLENVATTVKDLIENTKSYEEKIKNRFSTFIFNHGKAAEEGAKYILKSLVEKKKNKEGK